MLNSHQIEQPQIKKFDNLQCQQKKILSLHINESFPQKGTKLVPLMSHPCFLAQSNVQVITKGEFW